MVSFTPDRPRVHFELARALIRAKRFSEGISAFESTIELAMPLAASDRTSGARQLSKVALADREPSAAVRDLAATALGSAFSLDPAVIEIVGRPPVAVLDGRRLAIEVSLSHHGRFVAFAAVVPHAPRHRSRTMNGCHGGTEDTEDSQGDVILSDCSTLLGAKNPSAPRR